MGKTIFISILASILLWLRFSSRVAGFNFSECKSEILNLTFGTAGVVDRYGNPITSPTAPIEGYQYSYCIKNCGTGSDLNPWPTISSQLTLWLLPWLTLVAQIPFFTASRAEDIMVAIYTVGSPTTALYSVFLTFRNRKWLNNVRANLQHRDPRVHEKMKSISAVLLSLHQYPMEIKNAGLLACSLAMDENKGWWDSRRKWFSDRKRRMEASAWAQLALAVIAYLFAIAESFLKLGAHGLAIGNLWSWLLCLVWGWFTVGCHHGRPKKVRHMLRDAVEKLTLPDGTLVKGSNDSPIHDLPLVIREPSRIRYNLFGVWMEVRGDELSDGPFFNFARGGSWSHFATTILNGYKRSLTGNLPTTDEESIELVTTELGTRPVGGDRHRLYRHHSEQCGFETQGRLEPFQWVKSKSTHDRQGQGSSAAEKGLATAALVAIIGGGTRHIKLQALISPKTAFGAFIYAFLLQSVTGYTAMMIAFLTPTIGLGCRSLVYLLYNVLSTFSCLLFIAASYCFDRWSAHVEPSENRGISAQEYLSLRTKILGVSAVTLRVAGRLLAVLNTCILVTGCLLQFTGVYECCYCNSSYIGLRSKGFISLLSPSELQDEAKTSWGVGAGLSIGSVIFTCVGYFETSKLYFHRQRQRRSKVFSE